MKNILKRVYSSWFLLFLFGFFSMGMQAQYSENEDLNDWIKHALNQNHDSSLYADNNGDITIENTYTDGEYDDYLDRTGGDNLCEKGHTSDPKTDSNEHVVTTVIENDDQDWNNLMNDNNDWLTQIELEEQTHEPYEAPGQEDNQYPDNDTTGAVDPPTPDVPTDKLWYKDNDLDKYVNKDEAPIKSGIQPGSGYIEISANKGYDCDDANPIVGNCIIEGKNCDTAAVNRATNAKTLLGSSGLTSSLTKFRDKTNLTADKKESGLSIEKKTDGTYAPYNEQMGTVSNVDVKTKETGKTLVAGVHTHVEGKEDGPSPQDIYHLIEGYKENSNYTMDFNIAANGNEYVLVVENGTGLNSFLTNFPTASNINTSDNGFLAVANEAELLGMNSLNENFMSLLKILYEQGYDINECHEAALTIMLDIHKVGVKLLKKENGTNDFKELSFSSQIIGSLTKIKIEKCK